MYILYADESGDGGLAPGSTKHLVLAGVAMHEGQWKHLTRKLDQIEQTYFPGAGSPVEFHASDMRSGARFFRSVSQEVRVKAMRDVYMAIAGATRGLTLFAAVMDKPALRAKYGDQIEPYEHGFEALCTMFNFFLKRVEKGTGNVLRGIVVFDESRPALARQLRTLLSKFQAGGAKWAFMGNLIETAFFFDSRNSRMMQIADFVAYAVYRWYEAGDDSYLKLIYRKLDRHGSKLHGLKCYPLNPAKQFPNRNRR